MRSDRDDRVAFWARGLRRGGSFGRGKCPASSRDAPWPIEGCGRVQGGIWVAIGPCGAGSGRGGLAELWSVEGGGRVQGGVWGAVSLSGPE